LKVGSVSILFFLASPTTSLLSAIRSSRAGKTLASGMVRYCGGRACWATSSSDRWIGWPFTVATTGSLVAGALSWGGERFGFSGAVVARIIAEVSTFVSTAALFAAVYGWLPTRHIGWRAVVRATLISAALFSIGRWVVATWLATSDAVSSFGAAAALALVLLWFYYSAAIFYTAAILAADDAHANAKAK